MATRERAGGFGRAAAGLTLSCHPLPSLAVTGLTVGLAALAGLPLGTGLLLVAAVFTGQLSIGWSNDVIDASRDRATGRADKPLARGGIAVRTVALAAGTALVVTVVLSLLLGPRPGVAALTVVACGWAYNLGLKSTVFSPVPYAVAFGTLPAAATLALPGSPWPALWAMIAGALLGVAAHLLNVLPDIADDREAGVRGFPQRIGARATAILGPVLLLAASAVILTGPPGRPPPWAWAAAVGLAVVAATGVRVGLAGRHPRVLFVAAIAVAVVDLVLFALSGAALVR